MNRCNRNDCSGFYFLLITYEEICNIFISQKI